jgi:hypothetical protein
MPRRPGPRLRLVPDWRHSDALGAFAASLCPGLCRGVTQRTVVGVTPRRRTASVCLPQLPCNTTRADSSDRPYCRFQSSPGFSVRRFARYRLQWNIILRFKHPATVGDRRWACRACDVLACYSAVLLPSPNCATEQMGAVRPCGYLHTHRGSCLPNYECTSPAPPAPRVAIRHPPPRVLTPSAPIRLGAGLERV